MKSGSLTITAAILCGISVAVIAISVIAGAFGTGAGVVELDSVEGEVWIHRLSSDAFHQWERASNGERLTAGDQVRTGPVSSADLVYPSLSRIGLGPNTLVQIEFSGTHAPEASSETGSRAGLVEGIRLRLGSIWAHVVNAAGDLIRFEVETPVVVAGVRGTLFDVSVSETEGTELSVESGAVAISTIDDRVDRVIEQVILSQGQMVSVGARQGGVDDQSGVPGWKVSFLEPGRTKWPERKDWIARQKDRLEKEARIKSNEGKSVEGIDKGLNELQALSAKTDEAGGQDSGKTPKGAGPGKPKPDNAKPNDAGPDDKGNGAGRGHWRSPE